VVLVLPISTCRQRLVRAAHAAALHTRATPRTPQAFTATLRQRHLSPQELRAHLDAPSPPLEVLTVEKLLPAPLLARYIQAAA
jgi:hypothetical protein